MIGNIRLTQLKYKIFEIDIFILKQYRFRCILIKIENILAKGSVIHS